LAQTDGAPANIALAEASSPTSATTVMQRWRNQRNRGVWQPTGSRREGSVWWRFPALSAIIVLLALSTVPLAFALTTSASTTFLSGATTNNCGASCAGGDKYTFDTAGSRATACTSGTATALCMGDDASQTTLEADLNIIATKTGGSTSWTAASLASGDHYEIDFDVGTATVALVFLASGASAGTIYLYYCTTASTCSSPNTWNSGPSAACGTGCTAASGTFSTDNVGVILIDPTTHGSSAYDGVFAFYVSQSYLASIDGGYSGTSVASIYALTYLGGTSCPGSLPLSSFCPFTGTPTGTAEDRTPSGSGIILTATLPNSLPELPSGLLLLALPLLAVYIAARRLSPLGRRR
jgi:hypothetical protein